MATKPRNLDRTEYCVRDAGDWSGEAFISAKITDAYEWWAGDPEKREAFEFNLYEGTCRDLTDDFRDWQDEDHIEAAAVRRHERSYAVGTM